MRHQQPTPANPGANGAAVFYDDLQSGGELGALTVLPTKGLLPQKTQRVRVAVYTNVADAVLKHDWYAFGSTQARTINEGGTGLTVSANTFTQRDFRLMPGRNRIYLATTTAPSTFEVSADRIDSPALAQ